MGWERCSKCPHRVTLALTFYIPLAKGVAYAALKRRSSTVARTSGADEALLAGPSGAEVRIIFWRPFAARLEVVPFPSAAFPTAAAR
jgi:hypothetical protein